MWGIFDFLWVYTLTPNSSGLIMHNHAAIDNEIFQTLKLSPKEKLRLVGWSTFANLPKRQLFPWGGGDWKPWPAAASYWQEMLSSSQKRNVMKFSRALHWVEMCTVSKIIPVKFSESQFRVHWISSMQSIIGTKEIHINTKSFPLWSKWFS